MNTNNIVSTPEITGNIGSCKTELTKVINREGWFSTEGYNITTNSCNGQTNQTDYSVKKGRSMVSRTYGGEKEVSKN
jgi:hypothetical protein